jgi:hypothetical protein
MNVDYINQTTSATYNGVVGEAIVDAFGTWIKEQVRDGGDAYLLSFMFDHLPGSKQDRIQQMHDEITTFYRKLITYVVRYPKLNKNADKLPRGVFFPDVPIYKRQKQALRDVSVNDGLHMHGIFVIPEKSRLKIGLDQHVREYSEKYQTHKMYRVDVELIDSRIVYTTDYAGKALKTRRYNQDDILILPRTTGELESDCRTVMFGGRRVRDIQARYNVSEEVARSIVSNRRLLENSI